MTSHGIEQVWVPAGSFAMGSDSSTLAELRSSEPPPWVGRALTLEFPAHKVTISQGYWIDRTEVTRRSFDEFARNGGYADTTLWSVEGRKWLKHRPRDSLRPGCDALGPDHPVACVTWYEAETYATWRGGRLPSEAEWEFAARGSRSLMYPWGNHFEPAKTNVNGAESTVTVGSHPEGASWVGR